MTGNVAFVVRMAWRETRAAWLRLVFFFLCVALGVAAIVVLRSVVQNVRTTLLREARQLVGADLVVQSSRPLTPEQKATVDRTLSGPDVLRSTDVIETQTMAAAPGENGAVRLVEIRAVEPAFPFYGAIELADGQVYSHALLEGRGAIVTPELLAQLNMRVGDTLRIAGQPFTIRAAVTKDRVRRSGGFAFGPRVYIDLADLRRLAILGFGSRATYQRMVEIREPALAGLTTRLKDALSKDVVGVRTWQTVEDQLGKNLVLAENYLSLVGFAIVVLGGIGVWSVTRVFVQQKVRSVAILKCVGASSTTVLATYVLQVIWLSFAGSLLGTGAAAIVLASIPTRVLTPLGIGAARITASAALQGTAVGVLVSLLFALVPLLEMRRVKPLLLLRADTAATARRRDWRSWLATALLAGALAAVAVWQADSIRAGLYVSVGLAGMGVLLAGAARGIVRVVRPLTRSTRFAVRHAVVSLTRPGGQTRVIIMAVGIGCFFILGTRTMERDLLNEFTLQVGAHAPDIILIDIQRDQLDGVRALASRYVREPARFLPLMRARITAVDGQRTHLPTLEDVRQHAELTREYGITYRDALEDNEVVTAGAFWSGRMTERQTPDGLDAEVSAEELVHEQSGIEAGDIIRFDVAGRTLRARVTSIRKVTWDQSQNGGFVFVFRPSPVIDRLPQAMVGFLQMQPDAAATGGLERGLASSFPNVSPIDVRDVLGSLREVLANASLGVTVVGSVTLVGGVLILIGAMAMTRFQRQYEAAIYRTLGASTRMLLSMVAVEYGLVGTLAGVVGAVGALGLSWAAARHLFEIEWHPQPGMLTAGVVLTALLVGAVGLAVSAGTLLRKPLGTLRRE